MKNQTKATFFAVLAVLLWSTVATAFKLALKELHFLHLLAIASYTSTLVFLLFLVIKGQFKETFAISGKLWLFSAISGMLNPFLYYIVLLSAYSLLPAYMAQPLNYTWPIVLVLFSAWFLKQTLKPVSLVAFFLSLLGVFFISYGNHNHEQQASLLGIVLATGSSIIWSLYWIVNIKDQRTPIQKLFLNFLFGSIYINVLLLLLQFPFPAWNNSYIAAIYTGMFEMGVTFLLWLLALSYSSRSDKISIYIFLSPILSLIFISTILKEQITLMAIIGFLCILLGIVIIKWKEIVNFGHE